MALVDPLLMFQSAPAITGGRSMMALTVMQQALRFNPRPPSLAGDPVGMRATRVSRFVSIRARHHWRAIHSLTLRLAP